MRVQLFHVVALLFTAAYGQISSQITTYSLSFDGAAVVSLLWGLDTEPASNYNFYLCAGDETTGSYVCFFLSLFWHQANRTLCIGHSITSHHEWRLYSW